MWIGLGVTSTVKLASLIHYIITHYVIHSRAHMQHRQVSLLHMLVILAPPTVMGAWSVAFLLGQHVEY